MLRLRGSEQGGHTILISLPDHFGDLGVRELFTQVGYMLALVFSAYSWVRTVDSLMTCLSSAAEI
jgi:hypothetical protein